MKYADMITAQVKVLTDLMEQNKPFLPILKPGAPSTVNNLPYNPTTGRAYRGGNQVMLYLAGIMNGHADNRWMTYKQALAVGAQVRKGAKSIPLRAMIYPEKSEAPEGMQLTSKMPDQGRARTIPFNVFNSEHIDGLPPPPLRPETTPAQRMEQCEALLKASGAVIIYGSNQPYYAPGLDQIHIPHAERFVSTDARYATIMHELSHWSGHESRLARDMSGRFGSESYAREEVIAETASHIMGVELGIGHDPSQHAAYIKHWLRIAQEDPNFLYTAGKDAEKIVDFVGLERFTYEPMVKPELGQEHETTKVDLAGIIATLPSLEDVLSSQKSIHPERLHSSLCI